MKVFILLSALIFLCYGLGFVLFPEALSLYVTDTSPTTSSGIIDMRATYGGMSVGFGLLLVEISRHYKLLTIGVKALILVVGGMAFGRIIGIIQDGTPNTLMYIYLALEIIVIVIGVILLIKNKKTEIEIDL